ncbi:5'-methylthioadenosine/S-adenosylhomocysteine nucleosidase family protein [Hoylesella shahii]|uniref:Nucleoside phosphorylase n=2 Tax=Hoylesella shahii TaxID=228603 RepID=A0A318HQ07_9BACT|nr:hypothetical protein [Hoylesella shahii]PXX17728.1 nucleoside phosphorylase [Hoylesella shahii DSM 15611 = JCM 12083]
MIRILIMDDDTDKTNRVKSVLTGMCMVNADNIEIARSLNSGRHKLSKNLYDLLLLDLVLPVSDDDPIEPGKSEDFINELYRIGRFKKPIYVIGLSQYEDKVVANTEKYENKLWKLIHYDLQKDDWEQILQNAVESIVSTKEQLLAILQNKNKYDIGVICALSEEFEQMKIASGLEWKKVTVEGISNDFFEADLRTELGHTLKIIAGRNNMPGMQAASVMASCMFSLFNIESLFMTGICAGFKKGEIDSIDFGDIFIAESEYDYGSGKLCESGDGTFFKKNPKMLECDFDLKGKMNTFMEEKHPENLILRALDVKNLNLMKKNPSIHFKPGACGSYVVADKGFMRDLLKENQKLRGLDMEGYGLYMTAHILGKKCMMIKSISDFADSDKGDTYHKMCSYSSAWFLFEFLKYTY